MSELSPRAWRFYLDDMIAFAERVVVYTADLDQTSFVASRSITTPRSATSN